MTDQVMERLVAPADVAELRSVTTGQLAQMRYLETAPEYVKVGTRVRYAPSDVQTWLHGQRPTGPSRTGRSASTWVNNGSPSLTRALFSNPVTVSRQQLGTAWRLDFSHSASPESNSVAFAGPS